MISPVIAINMGAEYHNIKEQIWRSLHSKPKQNNVQLRRNKKAWVGDGLVNILCSKQQRPF